MIDPVRDRQLRELDAVTICTGGRFSPTREMNFI